MTGTLLLITLATVLLGTACAHAAGYKRPPSGRDQWYWQIDPGTPGLAGLPSTTGRYPAPGSANIWDNRPLPGLQHRSRRNPDRTLAGRPGAARLG